jgi:hypothetical protein
MFRPFFIIASLIAAGSGFRTDPTIRRVDGCQRLCLECPGIWNYGAGGGPLKPGVDMVPYSPVCTGELHAWCDACPWDGSPLPESYSGQTAEAVWTKIRAASGTHLTEVLGANRHRLLLDAERNLLVIQGSRCNTQTLELMVFLTPALAQEISGADLGSLAHFLARERVVAAVSDAPTLIYSQRWISSL